MAFVLNFAHGEYADVLAIHLVDNGFVCAKVQNRDDISNYQSKLAQFLGRKTRSKLTSYPGIHIIHFAHFLPNRR